MFFILYFLMIVGPVQLIGLVIRLCTLHNRPEAYRNNLKKYGLAVIVYVLVFSLYIYLINVNPLPDYAEPWAVIGGMILLLIALFMALSYWIIVFGSYTENQNA